MSISGRKCWWFLFNHNIPAGHILINVMPNTPIFDEQKNTAKWEKKNPADSDNTVVAHFPCSEALPAFCFNPPLSIGCRPADHPRSCAKDVFKKALEYGCVLITTQHWKHTRASKILIERKDATGDGRTIKHEGNGADLEDLGESWQGRSSFGH